MNRSQTFFAFVVTSSLALAAIAGCAARTQPQRTLPVSNNAYQLDELFTDPKGYTVYRFYDRGDYRYYVIGPNGAQMLPTTKTVTETVTNTETHYVEVDDDHSE